MGVKCCLIVVLNCIFLMTSGSEYLANIVFKEASKYDLIEFDLESPPARHVVVTSLHPELCRWDGHADDPR
jgi:hypothetical protein